MGYIFMSKEICKTHTIPIPSKVNIVIDARAITIKGPRGELKRDFGHKPMDMYLVQKGLKKDLKIDVHFSNKRDLACMNTVSSHLANMITGVTEGFRYRLREYHKKFVTKLIIENHGKTLMIQNFIGERRIRKINMLEGVLCEQVDSKEDREIFLTGNNKEDVSRSAALVCQACRVKNKDGRIFLDGMYVV